MYLSIFSDELGLDYREAFHVLRSWGYKYVDLRSRINGKNIADQTTEELIDIRKELNRFGLKCGVIQSSLAKIHLPNVEQQKDEIKKLERIIKACDILNTRDVRSFNFWQQNPGECCFNKLCALPRQMDRVLSMFNPLKERALEAGLRLSFENCGQTVDEIIAFLEALDVEEWGIAWDCANYYAIFSNPDEATYCKRAIKWSNMIHIKGLGVLPELGSPIIPYGEILANKSIFSKKNFAVSIETHVPLAFSISKIETSKKVSDFIKSIWPCKEL